MDPLVPALILSKALELGITEYGIKTGSFREANPFLSNRDTRITINASFMLTAPFAYNAIKRKNKKQAKIMAFAIIGFNSFLVIHNLRIIRSADSRLVRP